MSRGPDPETSAADILSFMVHNTDPGFTAREIADEFEKTRQWADNRLKTMQDDKLLESKNPGGRARFYWPSKAGLQLLEDERSRD